MSIGRVSPSMAAPPTLPTGPLPGETPEQYAYRRYQEQRYLEQQAEQRAYAEWQQAEARRYGEYQNADARAYGQYINADSRAYGEAQQADNRSYGEFLSADARAYNEARQAQSDAERNAYQRMNMDVQLAQQQAIAASNAGRSQVALADRQAQTSRFNRQPTGRDTTQRYRLTLGGY